MRMHSRHLLPLIVLALLATSAMPASAAAGYRVGIGEQHPSMFDHERFQALNIKRVRHLVPWDWYRHDYQKVETAAFMNRAHAAGAEVLVTFTAPRGCYANGRYSRRKACKPPSAKAYASSLRRFQAQFPQLRTFAPWNEVNHVSQPTFKRPALAARYYRVARKECDDCRIVAADLLDSSNVGPWLRGFLRAVPGTPKLWGVHNYADVNRRRSTGLRTVMRIAPGQIWLTETGGIVSFGKSWPFSTSRAANRTRYMFSLTDRHTRKLRGMRSRVTRLYIYQWVGRERGTDFDSGLTDDRGKARSAYYVVRSRMNGRHVISERRD
jgi:hypothetical protein